jgi:DNA-directed RNA polymerase specialized sigma24 family protein
MRPKWASGGAIQCKETSLPDSTEVVGKQRGAGQADVLEAITEQDLRYLLACGRRLCLGDTISAEDLLNEALGRTLAGDRVWRSDLPLRTQLVSTMKSVLHSWRKARIRNPEVQWHEAADQFVLEDGDGEMAQFDPAYEVRLQEQLDEMNAFLANDPGARDLMQGALAGYQGEELEIVTGMNAAQIIAARKRVSRLLANREN